MIIVSAETRAWLARVALSAGIALAAGLVAYLVARAVAGVALLAQHQQLLGEVAGAFRGGIDALAGGDLRELRRAAQQIEARAQRNSLLIGFAAAALAVVISYVWLERRAPEEGG
jgi:hypothetical protein